MTKYSKHTETICCPECNFKQNAEVINGLPFNTLIHKCTNCDYIITESDWQKCE